MERKCIKELEEETILSKTRTYNNIRKTVTFQWQQQLNLFTVYCNYLREAISSYRQTTGKPLLLNLK